MRIGTIISALIIVIGVWNHLHTICFKHHSIKPDEVFGIRQFIFKKTFFLFNEWASIYCRSKSCVKTKLIFVLQNIFILIITINMNILIITSKLVILLKQKWGKYILWNKSIPYELNVFSLYYSCKHSQSIKRLPRYTE